MKKLLVLLAVISLMGCDKEDPILSQAEQEIENAKLVGEWGRRYSGSWAIGITFSEDFKISSSGDRWLNDSYTIPKKGTIHLANSPYRIQYRLDRKSVV